MKVARFGAAALWIDVEANEDERIGATLAAADALRRAFPGADVVVGSGGVLVDGAPARSEIERVLAASRQHVATEPREHEVLVRYDGEDLADVARAAGLTVDALIERHASARYVVALLGFLPGFAYLEGLDPALRIPRRASPRPRVPAGSIAIAGPYTGVYPFASPGGWHLLGRAIDLRPFDPDRDPPMVFSPGDSVRFRPSDAQVIASAPGSSRATSAPAALEVRLAPAGATIQDGGRPARLGQGLPPSGPLDLDAHAAANEAVGNAASAAAIEIPLGALEVVARARVRVAVDGRGAMTLEAGDRLRVEPEGRAVRYLAARGGFRVPLALGARATLLIAHLGGLDGRALKKGDVLALGDEPTASERAPRLDLAPAPIEVVPGPHLDRFGAGAFERFVASAWTVSPMSDRVGVRLEGAKVERRDADTGAPTPMIRGAIQITTDGTPIVLGPDHPTTGGYPVLAVVLRSSWSSLARILPRGPVRFVG